MSKTKLTLRDKKTVDSSNVELCWFCRFKAFSSGREMLRSKKSCLANLRLP